MAIRAVRFAVLTPSSIDRRDVGRRLLESLVEEAPAYEPELYDDAEPVRRPFRGDRLNEVLDLWGGGFLWSRRSPRVLGMVSSSLAHMHDSIHISMAAKAFNLPGTFAFVRAFDEVVGVDLAYAHVALKDDTRDLEAYARYLMPLSQGLATRHLREGLPDLPWLTFFGPPYRRLFGKALDGVPAYGVEEVGNTIAIQLTEKFRDVDERRVEYRQVKERVKSHLGYDAFLTGDLERRCMVPKFDLPEASVHT